MIKKLAITILWLLLIFIGIAIYVSLDFAGAFDTKYSREELTVNFTKHEKEFQDLVAFFKARISRKRDFTVTFTRHSFGRVSVWLYPDVIDPANHHILGADHCWIGSPSLDTVLAKLGWTREDLRMLRDKLAHTGCNTIRSMGIDDPWMEAYPYQNGWSSFTYQFFSKPLSEDQVKRYGSTVSNSDFGKSVELNYESAL